mgnify:FL=1
MKVNNIIKKQTTIIAVAVILLTITVIGVSYSIFFDVKKNKNDQVITAGNLKLTVSDITALKLSDPVPTATGLSSTPVTYTVQNTASNLPADYSIYIYADSTNTMDLSKVKISRDGNATKGNTGEVLSSLPQETIELENGTTKTGYKISTGKLAAKASGSTNYLRIWVDEDSLDTEISNKTLNLKLYIVSVVDEASA